MSRLQGLLGLGVLGGLVLVSGILSGIGLADLVARQQPGLVIFVGGARGSAFAERLALGARQAAAELDLPVELIYSDWDIQLMLRQLVEVIDRRPLGIGILGHAGEAQLRPLVELAQRRGIRMTSLNVDLPQIRREQQAKGFGYVGASQSDTGAALARGCLQQLQLVAGSRALVLATRIGVASSRRQRPLQAAQTLREAGLEVEVVDLPTSIDPLPSERKRTIDDFARSLAKRRPAPDLLIGEGSPLTAEIITAWRRYGTPPPAAAFDLSAEALPLLADGGLILVMDQMPFVEGYCAVLQLALTARIDAPGLLILTGQDYDLLNGQQAAALAPLVQAGIR